MKILLVSTQWNENYFTGLGNCTLTHFNILKKDNEVITVGHSDICDYNINKN